MKLGTREIVLVSVLLAMLAGSYFFIFKKTDARRHALEVETRQQQQTLEAVRQATAGIDDLNRKIAEMQKQILFFQSRLPAEREVDKILKEVWQMASANNLGSQTIKTLTPFHHPSYTEQPIEMTLSGNFEGFYSFLQQLERLDRITRITQMKLQRIDAQAGQMQADVTLSIFFTPATGEKVAGVN
jgi:type IV pilus assembly protein PilO